MRSLNVFLFLLLLVFSSLIYAESTPVLEPGSRVVAGDLSQNEFYILGANEQPPLPASATATQLKTMVAEKEMVEKLDKQMFKSSKMVASQKSLAKTQLASNQKFAKLKTNQVAENYHHHIILKTNTFAFNKHGLKIDTKHLAQNTSVNKLKIALHHVNSQTKLVNTHLVLKKPRDHHKLALHKNSAKQLAMTKY